MTTAEKVTQSPPELLTDVDSLRRRVAQARRAGLTVGLVPTMGALHAGHVSLVEAAARECRLTIVTIFVNPTQFGPNEDFGRYPRTLEADLAALAGRGADLVFAPATEVMYPPSHVTYVEMGGPALGLEGACRPGHFRGVATIVLKLFNLVQPDRAYFGRKDYQQSLVVKRLVRDFDLPIHVEVCPTMRESDGLAMSSRNRYLSAVERERALAISRSLSLARRLAGEGTREVAPIVDQMRRMLERAPVEIDYVTLADRETLEPLVRLDRPALALVAARVGATRLIDNDWID
jgi:pantoate--beta-alanine ligase